MHRLRIDYCGGSLDVAVDRHAYGIMQGMSPSAAGQLANTHLHSYEKRSACNFHGASKSVKEQLPREPHRSHFPQ